MNKNLPVLIALLTFGIVSCSNKESIVIDCLVGSSSYEFTLNPKTKFATMVTKAVDTEFALFQTEYLLEEDKNFYYLKSQTSGGFRDYKISKINPKLTTESNTTFDCNFINEQ